MLAPLLVPLRIARGFSSPAGLVAVSLYFWLVQGIWDLYQDARRLFTSQPHEGRSGEIVQRALQSLRFQIAFMLLTWTIFPATWMLGATGILSQLDYEIGLCFLDYGAKVLFANSTLSSIITQLWVDQQTRAIRETEQSLEQETFLQSVGYEMKAPLNGIIGLAGTMINTGTALSDKQLRFLQLIQSSGQQLMRLADEIMDFGQRVRGMDQLDIESNVDMWQIAQNVAQVLQPLRRPGVELLVEADGYIPAVQGDRTRLAQVGLLLHAAGVPSSWRGCDSISRADRRC